MRTSSSCRPFRHRVTPFRPPEGHRYDELDWIIDTRDERRRVPGPKGDAGTVRYPPGGTFERPKGAKNRRFGLNIGYRNWRLLVTSLLGMTW
ncbi:MAG: hypothetical protein QGM50_03070 [Anaerolineae bacterium]|nr:hypothetical protein [Anaerolineae bacterium]